MHCKVGALKVQMADAKDGVMALVAFRSEFLACHMLLFERQGAQLAD